MSAPTHELATVRDWLRYAVSRFNEAGLAFGHGTTNAWDEAAYLVLHALHLPLDRLEPFLDATLTQPERLALADVLARRVDARIPAAYLTHEAWLGHFRFYVDERVIVPRSYIAELLPDHLAPFVGEPDAVRTALDLCTGSGCLAILLADAFALADIDAVDVSADALAVAQRNVSDYGLAGRINLIRSDVYANLADKSYDLVISNPPYVTAVAMDNLPPEHRREPAIALAGGEDGLDVVRRIVKDAPRHLNPRGMLVMEIGDGRNAVEAAFPRLELTWLATASSDDSVFAVSREALVRG
jgi:ribosomal protein L3 glutamine methyltransferase